MYPEEKLTVGVTTIKIHVGQVYVNSLCLWGLKQQFHAQNVTLKRTWHSCSIFSTTCLYLINVQIALFG